MHVRVVGGVCCACMPAYTCVLCSHVHAYLMHMVAVSHRVLVCVYVCVDPCVQCNEWSIDYVCMYSVCTCVWVRKVEICNILFVLMYVHVHSMPANHPVDSSVAVGVVRV